MNTFLLILTAIGVVIGVIILGIIILANGRQPRFNQKGFSLLEKHLLSELFDLFESDLSNKLQAQIEYLEPKRKWRQYWKKSISMELYGDNNIPLPEEHRYNRKDESRLATIRFKAKNEEYAIEFGNYNGRIWGWNIRPNPKSIMKETSVQIISKKINTDPNSFAALLYKKERIKPIPSIKGWLNQLNEMDTIKDYFRPISSEYISHYTNQINSKLPDGYLELIKQTEGLDFERYRILGVSEIYTTGLDDGNYYHLAEFDDGILAVKEAEENGKLYYCHYSGIVDELSSDFSKEIINKARH